VLGLSSTIIRGTNQSYQASATNVKIALVISYLWTPITWTTAGKVIRTSARRLGHPQIRPRLVNCRENSFVVVKRSQSSDTSPPRVYCTGHKTSRDELPVINVRMAGTTSRRDEGKRFKSVRSNLRNLINEEALPLLNHSYWVLARSQGGEDRMRVREHGQYLWDGTHRTAGLEEQEEVREHGRSVGDGTHRTAGLEEQTPAEPMPWVDLRCYIAHQSPPVDGERQVSPTTHFRMQIV